MSYTALDILYPMPEAILYEVVVSNQTPDVTTADVKETITVYKNTGGKREEADLSGKPCRSTQAISCSLITQAHSRFLRVIPQ